MKNQFVGDINDYYKYGLLRILSGFGKKKFGVCWMMTPDRTEYLNDRGKWRSFDRVLFDKLRRIVHARTVGEIKKAGILPRARFYEELFKSGSGRQQTYFDEMLRAFSGVDLIFFDPDVGLAPSPSIHGGKWLHYHELGKAFRKGHSVFVIQFPKREKADWVTRQVKEIREKTRAVRIYTFRASSVVFFLAAQQKHVDFFRRQVKLVKKRWGNEIAVAPDPDDE
jgi:hypothetical protein